MFGTLLFIYEYIHKLNVADCSLLYVASIIYGLHQDVHEQINYVPIHRQSSALQQSNLWVVCNCVTA